MAGDMRGWEVPPMVRGKAAAAGDIGKRWLDELDNLVCSLEAQWKIRVERTLSGGSHAFVGEAVGMDGAEYVLKIEIPDTTEEEFMNGIRALRIADGHGYAKLFRFDISRRASLLERLGAPLKTLGFSPERQMEIICEALNDTWRMPAAGMGLPDGGDSIGWFRSFIPEAWEAADRPCSGKVIKQALLYLEIRDKKKAPDSYVLLHGDAHNNNTLQSSDGRFRLIDPDGLFYEKAYDLGVLMREWPEEYVADPIEKAHARSEFLSRLTGVDSEAVRQWGFLQMVATSLILLQIGQTELGAQMLSIAEKWCG